MYSPNIYLYGLLAGKWIETEGWPEMPETKVVMIVKF